MPTSPQVAAGAGGGGGAVHLLATPADRPSLGRGNTEAARKDDDRDTDSASPTAKETRAAASMTAEGAFGPESPSMAKGDDDWSGSTEDEEGGSSDSDPGMFSDEEEDVPPETERPVACAIGACQWPLDGRRLEFHDGCGAWVCVGCFQATFQHGHRRCPYHPEDGIDERSVCGLCPRQWVHHCKAERARATGSLPCVNTDCASVVAPADGAREPASVRCERCQTRMCGRRGCAVPWTDGHRCPDLPAEDARRAAWHQDARPFVMERWPERVDMLPEDARRAAGYQEARPLVMERWPEEPGESRTMAALGRGDRFKTCPHCGVMVEFAGGCNIVFCLACRGDFCFLCLSTRGCSHFHCRTAEGVRRDGVAGAVAAAQRILRGAGRPRRALYCLELARRVLAAVLTRG